jgi:hypothetical protein
MKPRRAACILAALLAASARPAAARVLDVGSGLAFAEPSDAAAAAADGDTVSIAPGTYFNCSMWRANNLTIAGTGPGVVMTDMACAGKAAFVISGNGVTVRGIDFTRIRVPDGNGAGIRAEGRDLTVEDSRFINNQVAILSSSSGGFLRIAHCDFTRNGNAPDERPLHAVMAGTLDLLLITDSAFGDARGGGYILSAAQRTELLADRLTDEGGGMTGPLATINSAAVTVSRTTVTLGAGAADRPGAVLVVGDVKTIAVNGNTLIEPAGGVPFVRNWTAAAVTEAGNSVPPGTEAVSDGGSAYHRLRTWLAALRADARAGAGRARHQAAELARALRLLP